MRTTFSRWGPLAVTVVLSVMAGLVGFWIGDSAVFIIPTLLGANALYNPFKQQLLDNSTVLDLDGDIIKATLIDGADYTFSAAHDEYSGGGTDVAAGAKVAESAQLTSPTCTNGVFDTADFSWTAVTGDQSENIIVWDDTVTNDRLMAFYDTGMTGMPVTPNGGNINVTVNGSGWFAL